MHEVELETLNREALKAPMIGTGTVERPDIGSDNEGSGGLEAFGFDNPLDEITREANAGLEFEWIQSDKNSLIMGASTWEGTSTGAVPGTLPLQGNEYNVIYERRAKISYNEFYFGWKRTFLRKPDKYRFYGRMSLNEFFDIDFRDEHVFTVQGGPLDDIKRIAIVKGQTTGVLMFQFGLGGEYFLKRNISIGFEASAFVSERPFQLTDTSLDNNFTAGDQLTIYPPVRPLGEERPLGTVPGETDPTVDWTDEATPPPEPGEMKLRFDGWKAVLRLTVYY